ncbi:hypothetical protein NDU88_000162 [Pleurodeles waltl]|uniref:Uncharacterized protein n=1 Tax=Pleurodeles waltl TaxID=8319 RepID=A0AAV7UPQ7_PLEWA|nr:hypothetical protein NDU88_000162 [Pleurodeles waltl]
MRLEADGAARLECNSQWTPDFSRNPEPLAGSAPALSPGSRCGCGLCPEGVVLVTGATLWVPRGSSEP